MWFLSISNGPLLLPFSPLFGIGGGPQEGGPVRGGVGAAATDEHAQRQARAAAGRTRQTAGNSLQHVIMNHLFSNIRL